MRAKCVPQEHYKESSNPDLSIQSPESGVRGPGSGVRGPGSGVRGPECRVQICHSWFHCEIDERY